MKQPDDDASRGMGEGYALLTVGITFALTLTIGVVGGVMADRRWHTAPLWTILGTVLGLGLGGFWMYQRLRRASKDER